MDPERSEATRLNALNPCLYPNITRDLYKLHRELVGNPGATLEDVKRTLWLEERQVRTHHEGCLATLSKLETYG